MYISIGNISNNMRRAHRNGVMLLGFLACPKSKFALSLSFLILILTFSKGDNANRDDPMFRNFRRQLMHSSLAKMLESVKPGMTTAEVVRCSDDHFRQAVYSLAPYIGDYPEQTMLACVVQNWCPKSVLYSLDVFILTIFI